MKRTEVQSQPVSSPYGWSLGSDTDGFYRLQAACSRGAATASVPVLSQTSSGPPTIVSALAAQHH